MIIKVCGMRQADQIAALSKLEVDLMGMIFYPRSPRYALHSPTAASDVEASLDRSKVKLTGVFVSESTDTILSLHEQFHFDYIQLHGDETPSQAYDLKEHGLQIIRAMRIAGKEDFESISREWESAADLMLFDYKCASYGGSGEKFDWTMLDTYKLSVPFLLSGGIGPDDAEAILSIEHERMHGIDLNSRFESEPASKRIDLLAEFIRQIRNTER